MAYIPYYGDVNIVIKVDPQDMYRIAHLTIPHYGGTIADSINGIGNVWENLKLGWVGNTADEAQAFNNEWQQSIQQLFGTQDDPGMGILAKIAAGAELAAGDYDQTELGVAKMFTEFNSQLSAAPDPNAPVNNNRDINQGPISETG
jgi:hypothetical protein